MKKTITRTTFSSLAITTGILAGVFSAALLAQAATTIGTNISTGGTLSTTGTSTLSGIVDIGPTALSSDTIRDANYSHIQLASDGNAGDLTDFNLISTGFASSIQFWTSQGSLQNPTDTLNNDFLGALDAWAYHSNNTPGWTQVATVDYNGMPCDDGNIGGEIRLNAASTNEDINDGNHVWLDIKCDGATTITKDLTVSGSGISSFAGKIGVGTTTPIANFQVTNSSSNATTTMEVGKSGQTKGSCLKMYRTDGSAIYAYVAAGATTFTLSTTACANVTNF
jgi:hypothetical protein